MSVVSAAWAVKLQMMWEDDCEFRVVKELKQNRCGGEIPGFVSRD
jgi:hypothetical protein